MPDDHLATTSVRIELEVVLGIVASEVRLLSIKRFRSSFFLVNINVNNAQLKVEIQETAENSSRLRQLDNKIGS